MKINDKTSLTPFTEATILSKLTWCEKSVVTQNIKTIIYHPWQYIVMFDSKKNYNFDHTHILHICVYLLNNNAQLFHSDWTLNILEQKVKRGTKREYRNQTAIESRKKISHRKKLIQAFKWSETPRHVIRKPKIYIIYINCEHTYTHTNIYQAEIWKKHRKSNFLYKITIEW